MQTPEAIAPLELRRSRLDHLLHSRQQGRGHARATGAYRLGPEDLALFVDEDGCAVGDAGLVEPESVLLGHFALGVEICEKRKVDFPESLSPCFVAELRIYAHTQDLGIGRVELLQQSVQTRNLDASSRGEVEGVGDEQYILLAPELGQRNRRVEMTVEREVRCRGSSSDQRHGMHLCRMGMMVRRAHGYLASQG